MNLFSKPKVQKPTPVTPLPDDELIAKAKRQNIGKQRSRTGRDSTIVSDASYGNTVLGPVA